MSMDVDQTRHNGPPATVDGFAGLKLRAQRFGGSDADDSPGVNRHRPLVDDPALGVHADDAAATQEQINHAPPRASVSKLGGNNVRVGRRR